MNNEKEKLELYLAFRDSIGNLIDQATNLETKDQFLNVEKLISDTEKILNHGFIDHKTLFSRGRTVWDFIEQTLNSPSIITTVCSLTERAANERVQVYIEMALMQQSLGTHMSCLYEDGAVLTQWYHPTALLRDTDRRFAIISIYNLLGLLQGLNKLHISLHVKERPGLDAKASLANIGSSLFSKGDQAFKMGLNATIQTLGHVQSQVAESLRSPPIIGYIRLM